MHTRDWDEVESRTTVQLEASCCLGEVEWLVNKACLSWMNGDENVAHDEWLVYWGEKPYLTVCGLRRATAAKNCRLAVCESFRRFVGRPLSWYQQGWGWNTMLRHYCWQTEKTKTQELLEVTSHPAQQLLPTSTHAHPKLEPPQGRKKAKPDLLNLYALPQILKSRHTTANYRFRGVPHSNSQVM